MLLFPKRKLLNLEVDEVSLVDEPANGRKFFVIKQKNFMEVKPLKKELIELLKSFVPQIAEADLEKMDISEEDQEKLIKSLGVITSYKKDIPSELDEAITTILSTQVEVKKDESKEVDETEDKTDKDTVELIDAAALEKIFADAVEKALNDNKDGDKVGELVTSLNDKLDIILTCVQKGDEVDENEDKEDAKIYTEKEAQNMQDDSYNQGVQDTVAQVAADYGSE